MESVETLHVEMTQPTTADESGRIQSGSYLLELSLDWIVLRASENIHHLLHHSHVTLIDEPLGRFVHSQALHDLRNLFSRLSGTTGIARAYRVRLTDDPDLVDVAFQLSHGRVILEAVPSSDEAFGAAFGTVEGLIAGLASSSGQGLVEAGARRMRALTGYDRVTLVCGEERAESSRGAFTNSADLSLDLPIMVTECDSADVAIFPRTTEDTSVAAALLRAPDPAALERLHAEDLRSVLRVPFRSDAIAGEFRCDSRSARAPSFELHAAADLFAQLFAMRCEIDQLKSR